MAAKVTALALSALAAAVVGVDEASCPGATPVFACSGPETPLDLVNLKADPSIYDPTKRPPCGNSTVRGPTLVEAQLALTQLNTVNAKLGTVVINGYLRTWWKDPRLAYPGTSEGGCVDVISIAKGGADRIWQPDIYVDNLVEQTVDGMESLVQVYPDGSIWRSVQVLLTVKSSFDLTRLPYEEHTAEIVLASYSQDVTQLRLFAKGGSPGTGVSGAGLKSGPISSKVWSFEEGAEEVGFVTPGEVEVSGSWDYLTLSWTYSRNPKFFINQVIIPSLCFLLISYIQFWVTPAAVPARAALAIIPVLIMRTMSNSIYSSIPQGSQFMWLDVFVQISTFLCVGAGLHFGVISALRVQEAKKAAKLAGLTKAKPVAEKLIGLAREKKVRVLKLLEVFKPEIKTFTGEQLKAMQGGLTAEEVAAAATTDTAGEEKEVTVSSRAEVIHSDAPAPAASLLVQLEGPQDKPVEFTVRSEEARKDGVLEADLMFIIYAREIFKKYDTDASDHLCLRQVRNALTFFNIYMSPGQVLKVVAMFLRDLGQPSQLDETKNQLTFSQFVRLLTSIDRYSLRSSKKQSLVAYFQGLPPSERFDVGAQRIFPVLMILQLVVMYAMLPHL